MNKSTGIDPYLLDNSNYEWDYVESEGPNVVRYDSTGAGQQISVWVTASGNAEGNAPKKYKSLIEKTGLDLQFLKFI